MQRSVQVVIPVILCAFCRKLHRQTVVCELIQPDILGDGDGACQSSPLVVILCCRGRLLAQLPAGVDEAVESFFRLKNPYKPKLLHPDTQAGLHLEHLHEGFLLTLIVDR